MIRDFILKQFTKAVGKLSSNENFQLLSLFGASDVQNTYKYYTDKGYGSNPYLFMVVKKIADVVSHLDYVIRTEDGKEVKSGTEYDLLQNPNSRQSIQELINEWVTDYLVTGNGYLRSLDSAGMGVGELTTLRSKQTKVEVDRIGEITGYIQTEYQSPVFYEAEDILHIKTPNIIGIDDNKYYGLSPVEILNKIVDASTQINEASAALFRNKGVVGLLTNDSDVPMLPSERDIAQKDIDGQLGGASKFGKVGITNRKLRFLNIGMTPSDMKMIEQNIEYLRTICSVYGLDSSLFNDPENKTYSNRTEAQRAAYTDVFLPIAENIIVKNLNNWLFKKKLNSNLHIEINKDALEVLSKVNSDLTIKVVSEVNAGILTQQEAKEILYPNER